MTHLDNLSSESQSTLLFDGKGKRDLTMVKITNNMEKDESNNIVKDENNDLNVSSKR